jgi:nucleotide-binding universal stress UspA family protein
MDERTTTDGGETGALFDRVLVPVASPEDAAATAAALEPYAGEVGRVVAVHVVEKAGGAPDKLSVEAAEEYGEETLDEFEERLEAAGVAVETRRVFGTNVIETILETAHEEGATAVVFTPRDEGLLLGLLTGDRDSKLIHRSDLPVVALPSPDDAD